MYANYSLTLTSCLIGGKVANGVITTMYVTIFDQVRHEKYITDSKYGRLIIIKLSLSHGYTATYQTSLDNTSVFRQGGLCHTGSYTFYFYTPLHKEVLAIAFPEV